VRARYLPLLLAAAAMAAAGCGSSKTSTSTATTTSTPSVAATETTTTATATQTTVTSQLGQLPKAPDAAGTLPPVPTSGTVDEAYRRAVFNDAQQLWQREFTQGGVPYARAPRPVP
jgi:hypothetical protein